MEIPPDSDWRTASGSSMISIGTHRLFVSVSGPPLNTSDPLIVILAGAGDVASSYIALTQVVATKARILIYDRSGLGRSETGPPSLSCSPAVTAAGDLHSLLQSMKLSPPLILVAHSYGAIVAREYLHLHADAVAGMVLADGSTERQSDYFQIPDPNLVAVLGDLRFAQVTGLRAQAKLSRDEWRTRAIDIARGAAAAAAEANALVVVCDTLRSKRQLERRALGVKPLSVIRCNSPGDYERIYSRGVEVGNGSDLQRKALRELLDRWPTIDRDLQESQLGLSMTTHLVHVPDCGHNVHLIRPDVVAREIGWVLEHLQPLEQKL
ncbi:hypothetical protein N7468_002516 [Penicillium chermesinum]|uniref:AB hydrolase-1 domain-containing protein n=1 Tax=Penicillium chermesinum TaxID=63820 RepID=A0A9W9PIN9_9EURO|nr:uncharacterized protein N7468_002516 [Penicillium chermesinum]KAJ5247533.1 hypothetical protein N7468_002516 [Penicillium chermesinum]KAJ6145769.1 hypothetical protein N7470_009664 [Penicillium chermesinum]